MTFATSTSTSSTTAPSAGKRSKKRAWFQQHKRQRHDRTRTQSRVPATQSRVPATQSRVPAAAWVRAQDGLQEVVRAQDGLQEGSWHAKLRALENRFLRGELHQLDDRAVWFKRDTTLWKLWTPKSAWRQSLSTADGWLHPAPAPCAQDARDRHLLKIVSELLDVDDCDSREGDLEGDREGDEGDCDREGDRFHEGNRYYREGEGNREGDEGDCNREGEGAAKGKRQQATSPRSTADQTWPRGISRKSRAACAHTMKVCLLVARGTQLQALAVDLQASCAPAASAPTASAPTASAPTASAPTASVPTASVNRSRYPHVFEAVCGCHCRQVAVVGLQTTSHSGSVVVTGCSLVGKISSVSARSVSIVSPAFPDSVHADIRDCTAHRFLGVGDTVLFNLASRYSRGLASRRSTLQQSAVDGICAVDVTIAQPEVVAALPVDFTSSR